MGRDEIARLRHEAKKLRKLAAFHRAEIAKLKSLPIGQRQPIRVLEHQDRLNEYMLAAKQRDQQIRELRAVIQPNELKSPSEKNDLWDYGSR